MRVCVCVHIRVCVCVHVLMHSVDIWKDGCRPISVSCESVHSIQYVWITKGAPFQIHSRLFGQRVLLGLLWGGNVPKVS